MHNIDKRLGLLFGGLVGDAYGSRYEFQLSDKVKNNLEKDNYQIELKGGGPFNLKPGQITDDSELALALANSLKGNNGIYDKNITVKYYIKWFKSNPFDIGNTIRMALEDASNLEDVIENVKNNVNSLSNGCLMRIWPLLYYYYDKSDEEINKAAIDDCILTHTNPECIKSCVLYCKILKTALKTNSKKEDIVKILMESTNMNSHLITSVRNTVLNSENYIEVNGQHVKLDGNKYIGYIGLCLSIVLKEFLRSDGNIIVFMSRICSYGGDTDTNCCIGGALFGAFYGKRSIPIRWIYQISKLECDRYIEYPEADVLNFLI